MAIEEGHYVCCPMCQGKGQLHRSELIEQFNDPQRDHRLRDYLEQITQQQEDAERALVPANGAGAESAFEREVHSWPPKRILWRRSPKE